MSILKKACEMALDEEMKKLEQSMVDSEIKKALESEIHQAEYVDSSYCDGVDLSLVKNALDLINRQQAEIEELKIINEHLVTFNIENEAEIKRLKAEEEKYPFKCVMPFNSMVCSKSIEDYDRLVGDIGVDAIKEFANDLYKKFAGHSDYHGDTILTKIVCMAEGQEVDVAKPLDTDNIKIKAIKEFAERLKKPNRWRDEDIYYIDTLVKEMVG